MQNVKGAQSKMQDTVFKGAKMEGADFSGAQLEGTNLEDAGLQTANLNRAVLRGANLTRTDLRGANLRYVVGLTREQIKLAIINKKTLLPHHIKVKWTSETSFDFDEDPR